MADWWRQATMTRRGCWSCGLDWVFATRLDVMRDALEIRIEHWGEVEYRTVTELALVDCGRGMAGTLLELVMTEAAERVAERTECLEYEPEPVAAGAVGAVSVKEPEWQELGWVSEDGLRMSREWQTGTPVMWSADGRTLV